MNVNVSRNEKCECEKQRRVFFFVGWERFSLAFSSFSPFPPWGDEPCSLFEPFLPRTPRRRIQFSYSVWVLRRGCILGPPLVEVPNVAPFFTRCPPQIMRWANSSWTEFPYQKVLILSILNISPEALLCLKKNLILPPSAAQLGVSLRHRIG